MEEEIKKIREEYLDKFDGFPPYQGDYAYRAYIDFLESQLATIRIFYGHKK